MWKIRLVALVLLVAGIGVGLFVYTSELNDESRFGFKLGLDLAGGTLLTYSADTSNTSPEEVSDLMQSLRDVIERRTNLFGVSEPVVQVERASVFGGSNDTTENRLIVELPGVTDIEEAIQLIGETPLLEFKLLKSDTLSNVGVETGLNFDEFYEDTGLTGRFLKRALLQFGAGGHGAISNEPTVVIEFNSEGRKLFADITKNNVGNILAIFLDGVPISEPVIQTEILDGTAVITGSFNPEEARELVRNLNFGALPLPINLLSTQSIGAALGDELTAAGLKAGIIGLSLVALFLLLWYRIPGLVAIVSLGIYVAIILSIFKVIPVTLTAAGIAGFILSIGMAVDANILIFERIKEEVEEKSDMQDAIKSGFKRAWASIRDGNVSSLITAVILFWLGTSLVEGFALTFGVGVLVSMITAISVTRTFLLSVAPKSPNWLFKSGMK